MALAPAETALLVEDARASARDAAGLPAVGKVSGAADPGLLRVVLAPDLRRLR